MKFQDWMIELDVLLTKLDMKDAETISRMINMSLDDFLVQAIGSSINYHLEAPIESEQDIRQDHADFMKREVQI